MSNNLFSRRVKHAGDPWGLGSGARMEWAADLPFDVPVVGADGAERIPDDVDYLFWVGCAGALDDKAQRTSRAVAQLLHDAGVSFMPNATSIQLELRLPIKKLSLFELREVRLASMRRIIK